jgi:aerobic carbon-monoxide dehydrogenase medium subunit
VHPAPFEYIRVDSPEDAVELLAAEPEARLLAGGQSLIPMISLGLATPRMLIDISSLELAGLARNGDEIEIGCLTRHRELELGQDVRDTLPLATEAARNIGNPRVRNRGTFGGSLSHADPAAELGAVALAHGGYAVALGPVGKRTIAIDEFFQGFFETGMSSDEMLTSVTLALPPAGSGTAFVEVAQRSDDFAVAAAAAILTPAADGRTVARARLAVVGAGPAPARCIAAEDVCAGESVTEPILARIARTVSDWADVEDDAILSGRYRKHVAGICARRAVSLAWTRAREGHGADD